MNDLFACVLRMLHCHGIPSDMGTPSGRTVVEPYDFWACSCAVVKRNPDFSKVRDFRAHSCTAAQLDLGSSADLDFFAAAFFALDFDFLYCHPCCTTTEFACG